MGPKGSTDTSDSGLNLGLRLPSGVHADVARRPDDPRDPVLVAATTASTAARDAVMALMTEGRIDGLNGQIPEDKRLAARSAIEDAARVVGADTDESWAAVRADVTTAWQALEDVRVATSLARLFASGREVAAVLAPLQTALDEVGGLVSAAQRARAVAQARAQAPCGQVGQPCCANGSCGAGQHCAAGTCVATIDAASPDYRRGSDEVTAWLEDRAASHAATSRFLQDYGLTTGRGPNYDAGRAAGWAAYWTAHPVVVDPTSVDYHVGYRDVTEWLGRNAHDVTSRAIEDQGSEDSYSPDYAAGRRAGWSDYWAAHPVEGGPPTCGATDQPCCPDGTCTGTLTCTDGQCRARAQDHQPCGATDQPCCPDGTCTGTLVCSHGQCGAASTGSHDTLTGPPGPLTRAAAVTSATGIVLTWVVPATGSRPTTVRIERQRPGEASFTALREESAASGRFTDVAGVPTAPSGTWRYRLTAANTAGPATAPVTAEVALVSSGAPVGTGVPGGLSTTTLVVAGVATVAAVVGGVALYRRRTASASGSTRKRAKARG